MEKKIKIWYDTEGDFLEILLSEEIAYMRKTTDDNVLERIDKNGEIVGFNISEIQKIIENAVYNHLLFKGYKVFVGKVQNTEIDFVAEKNGETVYLQVAYLLKDESTINREFGNLIKIKDNFTKYVISYDSLTASNSYKGIKHITLGDFLLNF